MNSDHHPIEAQIAQRVKANVPSAALGAACLIYFGFSMYQMRILYVRDPFSAGEALSSYVFRIGGVLLLLAALWCWTGMLLSLMADAIVSTAIGVLLITSALLMMVGGGGGINILLFVVFGAMFVGAGLRNGRDFMAFRKLCPGAGDVPHQPHIPRSAAGPMTPPASPIEQASPGESATGSLAGELRRRRSSADEPEPDDPYAQAHPPEEAQLDPDTDHAILGDRPLIEDYASDNDLLDDVPVADSAVGDATPGDADPGDADPEDAQRDEPPPDGFLSSFADEDTPHGP